MDEATPRVENPRLQDPEVRFYHVWFSPKNRRAGLDGDVGDAARQELLRIANEQAIHVLACELGYDHAHMLIKLDESQTLPSVMHRLKGASAHRLFRRFPDLKADLRHIAFWQRGYGFRKLPQGRLAAVRQYVLGHRQLSEPRVFNPRGSSKAR